MMRPMEVKMMGRSKLLGRPAIYYAFRIWYRRNRRACWSLGFFNLFVF
jgi:hypothetical protein